MKLYKKLIENFAYKLFIFYSIFKKLTKQKMTTIKNIINKIKMKMTKINNIFKKLNTGFAFQKDSEKFTEESLRKDNHIFLLQKAEEDLIAVETKTETCQLLQLFLRRHADFLLNYCAHPQISGLFDTSKRNNEIYDMCEKKIVILENKLEHLQSLFSLVESLHIRLTKKIKILNEEKKMSKIEKSKILAELEDKIVIELKLLDDMYLALDIPTEYHSWEYSEQIINEAYEKME